MNFIRQRVLAGELMAGTWLGLGSSLTAEMAGAAGFDWVTIDMEHGSGGYGELVHQLQALGGSAAAPIVRVAWNEPPRFKRALDLGASGIMVPYVCSAEEAKLAAAAMRYPPQGIRGVAKLNRACGFALGFEDYFAKANDNLLTIVQIENPQAVDRADEIAAVAGVDVLFIGPLDLSVGLGIPQQYDDPRFKEATGKVVKACRNHGKAAGILLQPEQLAGAVADGYTFIALGSDGGLVMSGMAKLRSEFAAYKGDKR